MNVAEMDLSVLARQCLDRRLLKLEVLRRTVCLEAVKVEIR